MVLLQNLCFRSTGTLNPGRELVGRVLALRFVQLYEARCTTR